MKKLFTLLLVGGIGITTVSAQESSGWFPENVKSTELEMLINYWEEAMVDTTKIDDSQSKISLLPLKISKKEIAKSVKDGCYYGIGDSRNVYKRNGLTDEDCAECEQNKGILKTSESYVWGLTATDNDKLFYGTNMNYLCMAATESANNWILPPYQTNCWVCEYGQGPNGDKLGNNFGDWIEPKIYMYDIQTGENKEVTPDLSDEVLRTTRGIRSGISFGNLSMLAGPALEDGINFFLYNNTTGELLKTGVMKTMPGADDKYPMNIRRWYEYNGHLYCGVQYRVKGQYSTAGAILRWTGTEEDPFKFVVVGWTNKGPAEIVMYNNRLYVGTWPAGLERSKPIEGDYLEEVAPDAEPYEVVFNYADYDPDKVQQFTALNGAMAVYKGQLYFTSLHSPYAIPKGLKPLYGIDTDNLLEVAKGFLGAFRATCMFRLTETNGDKFHIELLYGEEKLPAYDHVAKKWEIKRTGFGAPLMGKMGYGNVFNGYTWSMRVHDERLFFGTFDQSSIFSSVLSASNDFDYLEIPEFLFPFLESLLKMNSDYGFDLLYIEKPDLWGGKAHFLEKRGFGNEAAMGLRNMSTGSDGNLYVGTANPLNIHETGGWQLWQVSKGSWFKDAEVIWTPKSLKHGEELSADQLNAKVISDGKEVPGNYKYTLMYEAVEDFSSLRPGSYNLRVDFTPKDRLQYPNLSAKRTLDVAKSVLDVMADTINIDINQELPVSYSYKMKGFVLDDDASVLEEQPVAIADIDNKQNGSYEIVVQGGKSEYYDFNYTNGVLIIQVPANIEQQVENGFALYPIPFKDNVTIKSETTVLRVIVRNIAGKEVFRAENPGSSIQLANLESGVYVISVETENGIITRKVAKAQ